MSLEVSDEGLSDSFIVPQFLQGSNLKRLTDIYLCQGGYPFSAICLLKGLLKLLN